jgi:hypothetical protein
MDTPFWADIPDCPSPPKIRSKKRVSSRAYKAEIEKIGNRSLRWERVNDVTWKLVEEGKNVEVPRVHGKWPGYRTSAAIAWVINVGWVAGCEGWLGRCRDKRGDWCLGPTTFEDARKQTKNWVLGLPVTGRADEWFPTNPARELHELQSRLMEKSA